MDDPHLSDYFLLRSLQTNYSGKSLIIRHKTSMKTFVCKIIPRDSFENDDQITEFISCITKLENIQIPFFIPLKFLQMNNEFIYLIRPYIDSISLQTYISQDLQKNQNVLFVIWKIIIRCYNYLGNITNKYQSIRPTNIFIHDKAYITITDLFWPSRNFTLNSKNQNLFYCSFFPPEYFFNQNILSRKSDIWSLGILLYYIFLKKLPWDFKNFNLMINKMKNINFLQEEITDLPIEIIEILNKMIKTNPNDRINLIDILEINFEIQKEKNLTLEELSLNNKRFSLSEFPSLRISKLPSSFLAQSIEINNPQIIIPNKKNNSNQIKVRSRSNTLPK